MESVDFVRDAMFVVVNSKIGIIANPEADVADVNEAWNVLWASKRPQDIVAEGAEGVVEISDDAGAEWFGEYDAAADNLRAAIEFLRERDALNFFSAMEEMGEGMPIIGVPEEDMIIIGDYIPVIAYIYDDELIEAHYAVSDVVVDAGGGRCYFVPAGHLWARMQFRARARLVFPRPGAAHVHRAAASIWDCPVRVARVRVRVAVSGERGERRLRHLLEDWFEPLPSLDGMAGVVAWAFAGDAPYLAVKREAAKAIDAASDSDGGEFPAQVELEYEGAAESGMVAAAHIVPWVGDRSFSIRRDGAAVVAEADYTRRPTHNHKGNLLHVAEDAQRAGWAQIERIEVGQGSPIPRWPEMPAVRIDRCPPEEGE